jgi:OmpA family protein
MMRPARRSMCLQQTYLEEYVMNALIRTASVAALVCCQFSAEAQPIAYPAKGQSQQQQQQDHAACVSWAKSSTGIDPATAGTAPPPPSGPAVGGGERVSGAARGAAGGAVIGAITGDAGKGAAVGAAAGTMVGGSRARQNRRNAQASAQAQSQNSMATFNQAYSACMSGRGYTM